VRWKFWQQEPYTNHIEVSTNTLARWYMYDSVIENPNYVSKALGMIPVSEEGEDHEFDGSEERLKKIVILLPFAESMAEINAKAMAAVQFERMKDAGIDLDQIGEEREEIIRIYHAISMAAIVSTLSSGVELGLLYVPPIGGITHE
jgi:hypothetical protein